MKELGANVEERFRAEGKHYGQTLAPDLLDGKYFKLGHAALTGNLNFSFKSDLRLIKSS